MEIVADFHLHSKYSRAVSPSMNLHTMTTFASQKGIHLLSAADFTHPIWFKEIQTLLEEKEEGIYQLRDNPSLRVEAKQSTAKNEIAASPSAPRNDERPELKFLLSTEIASIYKQGDKVRRIHDLIFAPNIAIAEKISQELVRRKCNLSADGRPIVGLSAKNLLELILSIDENCMLIPCHVWTPHFGVYGSASGFDSLEEAFGDYAKYVYAIETGISSDPGMNWHIKELENRSIVSFSDAHSAPKMAREATVFASRNGEKIAYTYADIVQAIKREKNSKLDIAYTIEFYPEEGKYHYSGHRNCKVSLSPEEVEKNGNICPVCHRKITEGVLTRVQQIAHTLDVEKKDGSFDERKVKWYKDPTNNHPPYVKLVPLLEIAAESLHSSVNSQKSQTLFAKLCADLGGELDVLLRVPLTDIARVGGEKVAEGVAKVREGNIIISPGFDGEYGKVKIWRENETTAFDKSQLSIDF